MQDTGVATLYISVASTSSPPMESSYADSVPHTLGNGLGARGARFCSYVTRGSGGRRGNRVNCLGHSSDRSRVKVWLD